MKNSIVLGIVGGGGGGGWLGCSNPDCLKFIPISVNPYVFLDLQTKLVKIYILFQTKMTQKPYPLGLHIPM